MPTEIIIVETGIVENTLPISGSIELDEAQPRNAPVNGVVNWEFVAPGDRASKGHRILQSHVKPQPRDAKPSASDQEFSAVEEPPQSAEPWVNLHDSYAPITGKFGKFSIGLDDEIV
ncbi:hypothetical protein [Glutamicibacter arilaitensis]|uniref:hypothetical protein n=1 Tax=Glutamicibacter arilaitensis TaxID=256701 RepID=UPI00384C97A4